MSAKVRSQAGHYLILAITLLFGLLLSCSAVSPSDGSKAQTATPASRP